MPGLRSLLVSLSEILESQGRPCKELEIWALLCRCAETLQDLIIKGAAVSSSGFQYMLTPNNLLVKDNGSVTVGVPPESFQGSVYMAPEFDSFSIQNLSETAFEKMFVYSLGRTLQVASEFGLAQNEVLNISYDLDSLLQTMTERNATVRIGLVHILEACALQSTQHSMKPSPSRTLSHLYKSVLASEHKIFSWDSSYGSDYSDNSQTYKRPGRMRRPRPQVRHRRSLKHSFSSRSRSRSGSHSPSRSRSRESGRRIIERPRTAAVLPATSILASNTNFLNRSASSSASEQLGPFLKSRVIQLPSSSASQSVQGLLGLRHGSPAFQKYVQLKERQIRLQEARNGKSQSVLENVHSRLMSQELMDKTSETVSMTSLMSYTLGSYMPFLNSQLEAEAPVMYGRDYETDVESMLDSQRSLVQGKGDIEEINRAQTEHEISDVNTSPISAQAFNQLRSDKSKEENPMLFESREKNISSKVELKPKQRQYMGPEFVHKARKPAIKVAIPFQNNAKNATHFRPVTVVHLTRQKFEITLDPGTTGRQLMDVLVSYTELDDFLFYGLTYISDGEHFFLDDDTKLYKIAPKGWKEGSRTPYSFVSFTLFVRVKFYPESLTDFRHKSSIHLLYLQLRQDIAEERIKCEDAILLKLAGMALQVEYGDYDQISCGQTYFQAEQYVPKASVRELGSSFIFKRITEEHEACFGTQTSDAEIDFIKLVMQVPEYGIHFYKLFKLKSQMNQFVWVGLSQHNLVLSDFDDSKRTFVQAYPWNQIMKISFNKRRFSIQPNVEVAKGKPPKLNFYTDSHRKGRYMLQFSTDQHRFQIQMRTRPEHLEITSGDVRSDGEPLNPGLSHSGGAYSTAATMEDPSQQVLPHDAEDDKEDEFEEDSYRPSSHKLPRPYQSPPPYQPPSLVEILVDPLILPSMNEIALDAHVANAKNTAWNYPEMHEGLEMSFGSTSLDSALNSGRTAQEEVTMLEPSQVSFMQPLSGRHIFKVILEREEKFGIGLTIVGGETTNSLDLGIFIKSVVPGGPADRDGRVKPGDRLIAIDGLSLEGKQHQEAVALFRDAGPKVELLISQIRPPGTLRQFDIQNYHSDNNDTLLPETDKRELESPSHCRNQTSFRYDDLLKESHPIDLIRSVAGISDEGSHPIMRPSTPPPPALPSQPPPTSILDFPDGHQEGIFYQTDALKNPVHDLCEDGILSSKFLLLKNEICEKDNETLDKALSELRVDHELSYRLGPEWSDRKENQSTHRVHQGDLTEEEKKDIQILGDIAALDVEASSSDSDFDTAVKNTLEGSGLNKHSKTSSDTFSIKALKNPTRNNPNDVIYEVILERQNGPYGIVIQTFEHPNDSVKSLCIKEILHGSPAHLGGILVPGDKIIEIQGQSTANMSPEEANAALERAKEFCVVKINRAAYTDTKLTYQPGMKHQLKNDSGLDSYHFTEYAGSLSYRGKPENISTEQIQSSSAFPRSHLIPSYPKETTKPLEIDLNIIPPPPALTLGAEDSESNTQSDVDSDVLDSSQSELEGIDSGQFFGDEPNQSPRADWNDGDTIIQPEEMNSASPKQRMCNIETNIATETGVDGKYVAVSPKDYEVTVIPNETHLIEKDVTSRIDVLPSCNSSLKNITDNLDENVINPAKSASRDEFSLEEKASNSQELETADRNDETIAVGKNESDKIKDINETVDRLPGGGLHEANEDVSQEYSHSESEDERKGLEDDGNKKPEVSRHQVCNPELVEATLIREPGGSFGFTIAGDLTTGGCYIKHLVSSPLAQYGTLIPGDKLLMVNSDDTTTLNHMEAVSLLRNGPDEVKLKLLRYPSSMQTQEYLLMLKNRTMKKEEHDSDLVSNVSNALDSESSAHSRIKFLEKKTDPAFIEPYEYEQTRIKTFASESRSKRSMSLSQQNITHGTVEVHHEMKEGTMLNSHKTKREEKLWTGNIREDKIKIIKIDLRKPDQLGSNLGISLVDREIDGRNAIVVKKLKPDGIAHTDGQLQPGDRLLEANSIPLVMFKAQKAVEILREAKDRVQLTVSRLKDKAYNIGPDQVITQDTHGFDENSGLVDSPKDCPAGAPEPTSLPVEYTSCRILQVNVPVIMSNEWLADLPLISLPMLEMKKSNYATSILQSLVDMVERGEPAEEFRNIRQTKADETCSVAQLPENKLKNRYRNVLPYDSNRVKLMNAHEGDYINASHISISLANSNDTLRYIVCQGPLEETMNDFWRMLWQERVNVIAMLTQAVERDKIRCHVYWPKKNGESLMFESGLQVKHVMSYELENLDVIQLALEEIQTGRERKLTMLQCTSWPDQGAPDTALPILQLLQVLHLLENGRPPLIHCSSGVGRTGVVIAVDIALACIEKGIKFDLYQIVRNLRCQRQGMVQTTDQYTFCYTACMEAILSTEMQDT